MARNDKKNKNNNDDHKMSREEAGHLGGIAPHKCRGRGCDEDNNNNRKSASSKSDRNDRDTRKSKDEDKGWFSSMFGDDDND